MNLLEKIDEQIRQMHLLTHPFYKAWQNGELKIEALQDYATQYYVHVSAFPQYLSALHCHTDCPDTRKSVLQNLVDEEAGSPNHPELWLQFARSLGVDSDALLKSKIEVETTALVDTFKDICRNGSTAAGIAALYSYESQIPEVSMTKIEGLQKFYGLSSEESLAYFKVHATADIEHSRVERELLTKHLNDDDSSDAVIASSRALVAIWNLLTGVCNRHNITCN